MQIQYFGSKVGLNTCVNIFRDHIFTSNTGFPSIFSIYKKSWGGNAQNLKTGQKGSLL